jgi:hypothetical protein
MRPHAYNWVFCSSSLQENSSIRILKFRATRRAHKALREGNVWQDAHAEEKVPRIRTYLYSLIMWHVRLYAYSRHNTTISTILVVFGFLYMPARDYRYYKSIFQALILFWFSLLYPPSKVRPFVNPLTTLPITIAFPYQTHCISMILHIQRHINAFSSGCWSNLWKSHKWLEQNPRSLVSTKVGHYRCYC